MSRKVIVIGAGFTGMLVTAYLATRGFKVEIFEKNEIAGGRARHFSAEGIVFDMGPSWYCFPEVIDGFFTDFNHASSDFFEVKPMDTINRVYFGKNNFIDIPNQFEQVTSLFNKL